MKKISLVILFAGVLALGIHAQSSILITNNSCTDISVNFTFDDPANCGSTATGHSLHLPANSVQSWSTPNSEIIYEVELSPAGSCLFIPLTLNALNCVPLCLQGGPGTMSGVLSWPAVGPPCCATSFSMIYDPCNGTLVIN